MQNTNTTTILLTGATGMIGSYILREFADCQVTTLGRSADNDIRVDLSASIPSLSRRFDLVVHCAGTTDEATANKVNRIGTLNLLSSLESQPPRHFIFISSLSVYGKTEGTEAVLIQLKALLFGLIEMTNGLKRISALDISLELKASLSAFVLNFGGLCVHLQCYDFFKNIPSSSLFRFSFFKLSHLLLFCMYPILVSSDG